MNMLCIFFFAIFAVIYGMQVIPERASVIYYNKSYLYNASASVRRYSRRSTYYLNMEGVTKHTWGNNVTVHLIFYEYLHNEYKRSFVEMHFKGCDMIKNDPYVGGAIAAITARIGLPCPAPAGFYKLMNITIPAEDFPNVWPFEKCKVEVILEQTPTTDIIAKGAIYATFKQKTYT
ncbi:uncharacterized protein [Choristoneura fumiferana]|uniref:uncharacterized protein n=1 Tax=Choristoneura fumiferana TaxID=7141 RepID=UPI003D15DA58